MDARYKARCEKLRARAEEQGNVEAVKEFTRRLNPFKTDEQLFSVPSAEKDGAAPAAAPSARKGKTAKKKKAAKKKTARRRK